MIRSWPSVLIGLFVPAFALLAGILLFSGSTASVLGIPVLFFWVFCCCPLTTLCLWISWRFFDRAHYPEDD
ncbi:MULTISPECIES: DUF3311 domain-containing protein [Amycolatopsis]|uniref:DUF3311 domain-containing protein n=1 Tax=Amycolatopsis TaxID=1813 RepID=UPI001C581C70|nr:DUF3311 domain-containing protein [Amycolatopsis sp. TNS106]QXV56377.1 hypothetical protein CVV72_04665 [Amycolatopsis sp. TNS106]